jgi:hypothetical protein
MQMSWMKDPRKAAVAGAAIATVALAAGGVVMGALKAGDKRSPEMVASAAMPPRQVVEDCNRYASQARWDKGRIAKEGVIGGAIGAGLGAAGGAIADGGSGAGKGAGIGAIVGAAAGTLHGLSGENRKSDQAEIAYRTCMARRGYKE